MSSTRGIVGRSHTLLPRPSRQHGGTMVETAISMVLFMTVMFGIIGFSQYIRAYHWAAHAARTGARYAIVRGAQSGHPTSQSSVQTFLQNQFVGVGADSLKSVTLTDNGGGAWPAAGLKPGQVAKVTVQVKSDPLVPMMPSTSVTITSSSQMMMAQ